MLGYAEPDELLEQIDESTFRRWQQFYDQEPFGPEAVSRMLARVAAAACGFKMQEHEFLLKRS